MRNLQSMWALFCGALLCPEFTQHASCYSLAHAHDNDRVQVAATSLHTLDAHNESRIALRPHCKPNKQRSLTVTSLVPWHPIQDAQDLALTVAKGVLWVCQHIRHITVSTQPTTTQSVCFADGHSVIVTDRSQVHVCQSRSDRQTHVYGQGHTLSRQYGEFRTRL